MGEANLPCDSKSPSTFKSALTSAAQEKENLQREEQARAQYAVLAREAGFAASMLVPADGEILHGPSSSAESTSQQHADVSATSASPPPPPLPPKTYVSTRPDVPQIIADGTRDTQVPRFEETASTRARPLKDSNLPYLRARAGSLAATGVDGEQQRSGQGTIASGSSSRPKHGLSKISTDIQSRASKASPTPLSSSSATDDTTSRLAGLPTPRISSPSPSFFHSRSMSRSRAGSSSTARSPPPPLLIVPTPRKGSLPTYNSLSRSKPLPLPVPVPVPIREQDERSQVAGSLHGASTSSSCAHNRGRSASLPLGSLQPADPRHGSSSKDYPMPQTRTPLLDVGDTAKHIALIAPLPKQPEVPAGGSNAYRDAVRAEPELIDSIHGGYACNTKSAVRVERKESMDVLTRDQEEQLKLSPSMSVTTPPQTCASNARASSFLSRPVSPIIWAAAANATPAEGVPSLPRPEGPGSVADDQSCPQLTASGLDGSATVQHGRQIPNHDVQGQPAVSSSQEPNANGTSKTQDTDAASSIVRRDTTASSKPSVFDVGSPIRSEAHSVPHEVVLTPRADAFQTFSGMAAATAAPPKTTSEGDLVGRNAGEGHQLAPHTPMSAKSFDLGTLPFSLPSITSIVNKPGSLPQSVDISNSVVPSPRSLSYSKGKKRQSELTDSSRGGPARKSDSSGKRESSASSSAGVGRAVAPSRASRARRSLSSSSNGKVKSAHGGWSSNGHVDDAAMDRFFGGSGGTHNGKLSKSLSILLDATLPDRIQQRAFPWKPVKVSSSPSDTDRPA